MPSLMRTIIYCKWCLILFMLCACNAQADKLPTIVATAAPLDNKSEFNRALLPPTFTPVKPIILPTVPPQDTWTPLATYTPYPTFTPHFTPVPIQMTSIATLGSVVVLPTLTPVSQYIGTEAEFRAFLRNKYSSIAGQNLVIEDISIYNEGGTYPHRSVSIELSSDSANNVFGVQLQETALVYGRNLLNDVEAYFGSQDFMVRVFEFFYDDYLSDRYFDDEWYFLGSYHVGDGWAIQKDYVIGHYRDGRQSLRVWNR